MSDRRDDSIAPRRSLSGSSGHGSSGSSQARSGSNVVLPPMPDSAREDSAGSDRGDSGESTGRRQKKARGSSSGRNDRGGQRDTGQRDTGQRDTGQRETGRVREVSSSPGGSGLGGRGRGTTTRETASSTRPVRPQQRRQARLRLTQVDPWSVTKTAFLLSIALGVATVVAVAVVWAVLGAAGVWDSINSAVQETVGDSSGSPFAVEDYVGTSRVLGFTMIVAAVNVVLITMIATLGAFLYNLAATLVGGVEVTLAEED
jgi:hypothetical protein